MNVRRVLSSLVIVPLGIVALALLWLWPRYDYLPAEPSPWIAERIGSAPLIEGVGEERGYVNINGPTVIRVPDWVTKPMGRYYMYFAHHKGSYIRLAYADSPAGPWTVHDGGVLTLAESGFPVEMHGTESGSLLSLFKEFSLHVARDFLLLVYRVSVLDPEERAARGISAAANKATHVASPEIVIDNGAQRILMYYHGYNREGGQSSRLASSSDGLTFEPLGTQVFSTYLRGFEHRGTHYLLGMMGVLYRGDSAQGPFEPRDRILLEPDARHMGLLLEGDDLWVFWSMVGYAPERLLLSKIDLSSNDWNRWRATAPVDVLAPELPWEGSEVAVLPSLRGEIDTIANELRDPYVFTDEDGSRYLYYVGGGEKAIGVARLLPTE